MASYTRRSERNFVYSGFYLNSGSYKTLVNGGSSANWNFQYPNGTGVNNNYILSDGGSASFWSPTGPTGYRPVAVDDFYKCRTNEAITINVVSGVAGNTGGVDTPGKNANGLGSSISGFNLVVGPSRGTMVATGSTGGYVYRSWPRWTGVDYFKYTVTDSSGVTSNIGVCEISVEATGIQAGLSGPTGSHFIFISGTGIYKYPGTSAGITSIYTASFNINTMGVNRNDNLIYYTNGNISIDPNVYAYDYVNNYSFVIFSAYTNIRFSTTQVLIWNGSACCYDHDTNVLYMCSRQYTRRIFKIAVNPYVTNGTTGYQTIAGISALVQPASIIGSDIAFDNRNRTLVRTNDNANYYIMCPTSQYLYKTDTVPGITGYTQICFDEYSNPIISYGSSNTVFNYFNIHEAKVRTIGTLSQVVGDLTEYMNEPIS